MKKAEINTDKGVMKVEFYENDAPGTVDNFVNLAQSGFYDGLTFHRVIPDFVIQGGCPDGTGMGGPGYTINAEFNDVKHVRGTLSMARAQDPNSASSQFFICVADTPQLNGSYTVFGYAVTGQDVADVIEAVLADPERPVVMFTIGTCSWCWAWCSTFGMLRPFRVRCNFRTWGLRCPTALSVSTRWNISA